MKSKFSRWLIAAGMLGALTFSASASQAAVDKCQKEIFIKADLYRAKVKKALQLCLDTVRTEDAKNAKKAGTGFLVNAAHKCQTELGKVFNTSGLSVPAGKSQRDLFLDAINKAFTVGTTPKCATADLLPLGHLASGSENQAPGSATHTFAANWLAVQASRNAYNDTIAQARDAINNINRSIAAASKPPGTSVATKATDCSLGLACNPKLTPGCRPDLCQMTKVQCRIHSCRLKATSSATSYLGALGGGPSPLPLSGSSNLEICQMTNFGYGIGNSGDGVLVMGTPVRAISPVSLLGNIVCVDTVASAGFCSSGGSFNGIAKNYAFCQDRVAGPAPDTDTCTGTAGTAPADPICYCHVSGIPTTTRCGATFPACAAGDCGMTSDGSPCFPGTQVGPVKIATSGTTATGDCVILNSTSFSTVSASNMGPDMTACTNDDTAPRAAVATTPFTTGTSSASLKDAVLGAPGSCVTNTNHACVTDADCTTSGGADTCNAITTGDINAGPLTGAGLASTLQVQTSTLANLKLVGAFPAAGGTLGDLATDFTIECQ
jgi:hypothetical protein